MLPKAFLCLVLPYIVCRRQITAYGCGHLGSYITNITLSLMILSSFLLSCSLSRHALTHVQWLPSMYMLHLDMYAEAARQTLMWQVYVRGVCRRCAMRNLVCIAGDSYPELTYLTSAISKEGDVEYLMSRWRFEEKWWSTRKGFFVKVVADLPPSGELPLFVTTYNHLQADLCKS